MALQHPVSIDQSPALASGDNRDNRAPTIAANAPFGNDVEAATLELDTRKRLLQLDPNAGTQGEVKQSRRRLATIETTEAQIIQGVGVGAVLDAIQGLRGEVQGLRGEVQGLRGEVQGFRGEVQGLDVKMSNFRRREQNRNNLWTLLGIERAGANPVGTVPPNHPASRRAVFSLTGQQITALETSFNLPLGHFSGANLAARRSAVFVYLTEG